MARKAVNPKGPHEPRRQEATGAILDAATELLAEFGVHGFSIADVGVRCGRPPAAIIHYYKSRVGLLVATAEHLTKERAKALEQGDDRTFAGAVRATVAYAVQQPTRAQAMATLETCASLPAEAQAVVEDALGSWQRAMQRRMKPEPGRAAALDPVGEVCFVAAALSGIILSCRSSAELQSQSERLLTAINSQSVAGVPTAKRRKATSAPTLSASNIQGGFDF